MKIVQINFVFTAGIVCACVCIHVNRKKDKFSGMFSVF